MKYSKTFTFPKISFYGSRKVNLPEIEVELNESENKTTLSICGGIWNSSHTDYICCGQCLDTMNEFTSLHDNPLFRLLYRLWSDWHLNDLHAGTEAQEKALKDHPCSSYTDSCEYLKSIDLYEDNGYIYGSSWLYRPIPEEVLNEIKSLFDII